jgi:hypothetical protein
MSAVQSESQKSRQVNSWDYFQKYFRTGLFSTRHQNAQSTERQATRSRIYSPVVRLKSDACRVGLRRDLAIITTFSNTFTNQDFDKSLNLSMQNAKSSEIARPCTYISNTRAENAAGGLKETRRAHLRKLNSSITPLSFDQCSFSPPKSGSAVFDVFDRLLKISESSASLSLSEELRFVLSDLGALLSTCSCILTYGWNLDACAFSAGRGRSCPANNSMVISMFFLRTTLFSPSTSPLMLEIVPR